MKIVDVTFDPPQERGTSRPLSIEDLLFDGKPFPFPTTGPVQITIQRDRYQSITVTIPFFLAVPEPVEPLPVHDHDEPHTVHVFNGIGAGFWCVIEGCGATSPGLPGYWTEV